MRIPLSALVLALVPTVAAAQATTVEEPQPPGFIEEFTRLMGIQRAIGDLRKISLLDSALELRFWSIGWTMTGVRLERSPKGEWRAYRVDAKGPNAVNVESLTVVANDARALDSLWNEVVGEGILGLPTHVPRKWMMIDGHGYLIEIRRGQAYRAVHIEHVVKPEVPADSVVKRIASAFKRRFPFLPMPVW